MAAPSFYQFNVVGVDNNAVTAITETINTSMIARVRPVIASEVTNFPTAVTAVIASVIDGNSTRRRTFYVTNAYATVNTAFTA